MLRRIINVLLVSALLTVGLTASVAMANTSGPAGPNPDLSDRGQPNADEDKVTGKPHDPDAWGSVASALGDAGVMGEHSSNPFVSTADQTALPQDIKRETPRDGLGNVAMNDFDDHGT